MSRTKIRVVELGNNPHAINFDRIRRWRSEVFSLIGDIERYDLRADSDLSDWSYSDSQLAEQLPPLGEEDVLVAITTVPLEENYHTRRVRENMVVFSFHTVKRIRASLSLFERKER